MLKSEKVATVLENSQFKFEMHLLST